ncbi:uncharacterized protein PpBr36_10959 [Neofusicoccum parvum]|uniref:Uncharacterized protein PpBr36_10959 n=1 Tax=Neofusicoccum parvum TaxID=310453 RepID=A0ACB5SDW4_9PEZI|nr:uncharacterized protein PpBr36_10959 [Neofusicoccum parvum]
MSTDELAAAKDYIEENLGKGLCNGPATFQQYINEVMIAGLDDFYSVFMDDILVYSLCNYYRRFIKNYSRIAKPLTDLTKNKVAWAWTSKCEAAF